MSRVTRREWYERVNTAWPAMIPPLTSDEAVRAWRKLYRFGTGRTLRGTVKITSGNRRNRLYAVNPAQGWKELVHVVSHYAERSGHNGKHARMELRMIREVQRRGWLDGALKRPDPAPVVRDLRRERHVRILQRVATWEAKLRRAQRALARLHRSQRYYERQVW